MTPVKLEPATPRSRVKHSTTEPLRSMDKGLLFILLAGNVFLLHQLFFKFSFGNTNSVKQFVSSSRSDSRLSAMTLVGKEPVYRYFVKQRRPWWNTSISSGTTAIAQIKLFSRFRNTPNVGITFFALKKFAYKSDECIHGPIKLGALMEANNLSPDQNAHREAV